MARISNNKNRGGWFSPRFFISVLVCVALLGAGIFWHRALESVFWSVMAPLERARMGFGSSDNTLLRAELASTSALIADRNALYQENLELKNRLGRVGTASVILAGVLLRPPAIPYDTLLVDAGEVEGVHAGDFVSAGGTTRIGTVGEVYAHTSRVILFSSPGQTYDALLHLASTTHVVPISMQGQGSGSFMGQVPAGTPVKVGDSIIFPGIASSLAGSVSSVLFDPKQSFATLYARLPVDLLSLRFVEIEKDSYAR